MLGVRLRSPQNLRGPGLESLPRFKWMPVQNGWSRNRESLATLIGLLNCAAAEQKNSSTYPRSACYISIPGRRTTIHQGKPMSHRQGSFVRKATLAGLAALCVTSTAFAQTAAPATGLGQAWPNAADVSANPNWHVYVFVLNGIRYIQVNDLNGTVHAAVGTANGTSIVLPVGVDSQNVTTPAQNAPASTSSSATSSAAQTVYQDNATTVTAAPQSNGTTQFSVLQTATCTGMSCSGGGAQ